MKTRKYHSRKERKNKTMHVKYGGNKPSLNLNIEASEKFRRAFINVLNRIKNNPSEIRVFNDFLQKNASLINEVLIPVAEDKTPVIKGQISKLVVDYVPLLMVVFDNIEDNNVKRNMLEMFYRNNGNMNLKSRVKKESVLSNEIKKDSALVKTLTNERYNADISLLPEDLREKVKNTLRLKERNMEQPTKLEPVELLEQKIDTTVEPRALFEQETSTKVEPVISLESEMPTKVEPVISLESEMPTKVEPDISLPTEDSEMSTKVEPVAPLEQETPTKVEPVISLPTEDSEMSTKVEPEIEDKFKNKLVIPTLEFNYHKNVAPEFWLPIFTESELFYLREKLTNLYNINESSSVVNNPDPNVTWGACEIVRNILPGYYLSNKMSNVNIEMTQGPLIIKSPKEFSDINTFLCILVILVGVLTYKMREQKYHIILKGGKATQILLSDAGIYDYISEDIDILVAPKKNFTTYIKYKIENLSLHIAFLIRWLLLDIKVFPEQELLLRKNQMIEMYKRRNIVKTEDDILIEPLLMKMPQDTITKTVVKLSYGLYGNVTALMDIDFKKLLPSVENFFNYQNLAKYEKYVDYLNMNVLFVTQTLDSMLREKLYYIIKYFDFANELKMYGKIREQGYEDLNMQTIDYITEKFMKAYIPLIQAYTLKLNPSMISEPDKNKLKKEIENNIFVKLLEMKVPDNKILKLYNIILSKYSMYSKL